MMVSSVRFTVTLFTKPRCTLCVPVKQTILCLQKEGLTSDRTTNLNTVQVPPFAYHEVDISLPQNKPWYNLYKFDIPVVHVDAKPVLNQEDLNPDSEIARHNLSREQLLHALRRLT